MPQRKDGKCLGVPAGAEHLVGVGPGRCKGWRGGATRLQRRGERGWCGGERSRRGGEECPSFGHGERFDGARLWEGRRLPQRFRRGSSRHRGRDSWKWRRQGNAGGHRRGLEGLGTGERMGRGDADRRRIAWQRDLRWGEGAAGGVDDAPCRGRRGAFLDHRVGPVHDRAQEPEHDEWLEGVHRVGIAFAAARGRGTCHGCLSQGVRRVFATPQGRQTVGQPGPRCQTASGPFPAGRSLSGAWEGQGEWVGCDSGQPASCLV